MNNIITIDGPSGAGKTSAAILVADKLSLRYIPSGKLYRAVAYYVLQDRIDINDPTAVASLLASLELDIDLRGHIISDGKDISKALSASEIGIVSSIIAQNKKVRQRLTAIQRYIGKQYSCVIEGRSTAIEIFPEASLKIWLTANEAERLRRKAQAEGQEAAAVVSARDGIDKTRQLAPMQKAEGAITIDSTHLSVEQVAKQIIQIYHQLHV